MVATVRSRTVAILCIAVLLISATAVLGLASLLDLYTRRQVDLAAGVLAFVGSGRQQSQIIDPDQFAARMPSTATIVFADGGGTRVVWSTAPGDPAAGELERLLQSVASGGVVDVPFAQHMVKAQLLRFGTPVLLQDKVTGELRAADSAVVALGTRSSVKLLRVMIGVSAAITVVTMVGAALAVTIMVRATMRPLSRLADLVGALGDRPPVGSLRRGRVSMSRYQESSTLANAIAGLVDRRARIEAELREFVANASHELRTPLTKIQGWSELHFQTPPQAERTERAMRSIVEECDRMRGLLDQLTLLARAEAPQQLPTEHVDVCALCAVVAEDVAVVAPDRRVTTRLPSDPVFVVSHEDRLAQVLRNVVGNSLAHAGDDAVVDIAVETDDLSVRIVLSDNGVGIPAVYRARVFDRFFTRTRGTGSGSGLGLSIVQAIVSGYGGSVQLWSEPGRGTKVTIALPRVRRTSGGGLRIDR